tara:strand:+ start:5861 stop:7132 length:1272 start_codon:yes stop_codon:yes gene_type:complete
MKLQRTIDRLQKLHPKEIDLSLGRVKNLCKKLGDPQNKLDCISFIGTNGKYSTIQSVRAILNEAKYKLNIYTSPHIQRLNERFIYNNEEIDDNKLNNLLSEVEEINNGETITYFEFLTASFFYGAIKYNKNINLVESGLFHRFDATNILTKNLASVITPIGLDHTDWLPENEKTLDKIIFEKTSTLLKSIIVISKQVNHETYQKIEKNLLYNSSQKIFFGKDYSFSLNENGFIFYEDKFGGLKLPTPNLNGEFQLTNIAAAIALLRNIEKIKVTDENIKNGIKNIYSIARLQEIKSGNLKSIIKRNRLFLDGSHNSLGAQVLSQFLKKFNSDKHLIVGMMSNKQHLDYFQYFRDKEISITLVDIPNHPNSIKGTELRKKLKGFDRICYQPSINDALKNLKLKKNDIVIITGSLYLAGEILNLN